MRVDTSVDIDRPVEDVFAHWSRLEKHPEWGESVLERRKITDGPVGLGTKIHGVDQFPGRKVTSTIEITAYEPNRLMEARWSEPTPGLFEARFEPTDTGTRFDFIAETNPTGLMRLIVPLFKGLATRRTEQYITAFKGSVESEDR